MALPDNDMVNPGDGPLRPEPWGLFFFIAIIIFSGYSEPAVCSMRQDCSAAELCSISQVVSPDGKSFSQVVPRELPFL